MSIIQTKIKDLLIVERQVFGDARGFFVETLRLNELEETLGRDVKFVQQNHSRSMKNVLRGIHTAKWNKLIYAVRGEVFCAFVDFRLDSPTFGEVETINIGENNRIKVFVPEGVGNSICVTSEWLDYCYDVTAYYDPAGETAAKWNDPDLAIKWPTSEPILSQRDIDAKSVRELFPEKYS